MPSALFALLFSFAAIAGFEDSAPVLKCPAVPESYGKMLTSLKALQTQIKADAGGACSPVRDQVTSLESLISERRKTVVDLLERSKEQPLQDSELQLVRQYVNDVTTKVFNTAELFERSNHCFQEDQREFGFNELAAITLDATSIAKMVAGPWSAPVALGGQALAGIFQGLDTVVKSRRGFDFNKLDQRQSFVQSLCSYFNYRQDMEGLMFPARRAGQLSRLQRLLQSNLEDIAEHCPECKDIINDARREKNPTALSQLATKTDSIYVRPLGTYTVQSLSAIEWVRSEGKRLREQTGDEFSIGRDLLSEKVADMDRFFYTREGPRFVKAQASKASQLLSSFLGAMGNEARALAWNVAQKAGLGYEAVSSLDESDLLEFVTSRRDELYTQGNEDLAFSIDEFERRSLDLLDRTVLAFSVQESFCRFFRQAGYYNVAVKGSCENSDVHRLRKEFARLEGKGHGPLAPRATPPRPPVRTLPGSFPVLPVHSPELSLDWADALSKTLHELRSDDGRFEHR